MAFGEHQRAGKHEACIWPHFLIEWFCGAARVALEVRKRVMVRVKDHLPASAGRYLAECVCSVEIHTIVYSLTRSFLDAESSVLAQ